jgi:hypothetical protein
MGPFGPFRITVSVRLELEWAMYLLVFWFEHADNCPFSVTAEVTAR